MVNDRIEKNLTAEDTCVDSAEKKPDRRQEKMKYRLAAAMKKCMERMPVEKVTVKEIVEECGTTRQTFYRHFLDKYDLINWYFDKILSESFKHMGTGETVYESLVRKFRFIEHERLFFDAAFRYDDQNSLRDHDYREIHAFYTNMIESRTKEPLSSELNFILEMYCRGSVYMTTRWVSGEIEYTPEEMAKCLVEAMPAVLAEVFRVQGLVQ
ncbi:probable dihydroxyacetone kinase regulator [uncultured Eubacterium sp.]|nr:probable dihydroxyacetone kinase regulator [uncultured Eubacterium sp.]